MQTQTPENVSLRIALRWPIQIIKRVDKTELSCKILHGRNAAVLFRNVPLLLREMTRSCVKSPKIEVEVKKLK